MKLRTSLLFVVAAASLAAGQRVWADETADQIKALREQIDALDQKLRILERQKELDTEAAETKAKEAPKIIVGDKGLSVSSADSNFVFQLHGVLQIDNRTFFNDTLANGKSIQGNDTFLLRRARPIFSGTVYRDFDFYFVPDFGGSSVQIFDAYLNYRYAPWLQLRAGKFKTPVGLEELQADLATSFNERALPNNLIPNRDMGFQLWGDVAEGKLSYALGVFNGVGDGRNTSNSDFEDHRELAARVFLQPFRNDGPVALQNLGFGVGGTWGKVNSNSNGLPSSLVTDGQQTFFSYNPTNGTVSANGTHWHLSPQAYYYYGPLSLLGEYVISSQEVSKSTNNFATLQNTAWQVSAGWVLTGEDAGYAGVTPRHPFNPSAHQWGAFQLVARYAQLDVDNKTFPVYANPATSASGAEAWAVGLNWYLNKNIRVNTSFSRTTFDGPIDRSKATVTRNPEEVIFTRLQLAF